jgi:uncharacterized membrane protein HdeD (DUF308 family)
MHARYALLIVAGIVSLLVGIYVAVGAPYLSANQPDGTRLITFIGLSFVALAAVLIARGARGNRP